ncbi:MAG: glycoside hydrolase family 9 protein [Porcipelethomonas sp.]
MIKKKLKKAAALLTISAVTALNVVGTAITPATYVSAGQQLGQTDFENGVGLPWHVCESQPGEMEFDISDGVYKITIVNPGGASNGGEDRWDCQFRHRGLTITSGDTYKVSFEITASNDCTYYTKIGDMAEPFAEDWHGEPDPSQHEAFWNVQQLQANQTKKVEGTFTASRTAEVEWAFHIGGDTVPAGTVFTFDNMSLECTTSSENDYVPEEEWVRSDILTNQLGYFSDMKKRATLLSDASSAVKFELKDSSGKTVFDGKSEPKGADADSGDSVHVLDFSDFNEPGTYYLEAENGAKSREFQIGGGELYSYMLYDSLNYFYQNRSGIEIESQYIISGDSSALARAAGHPSDIATVEQTWGYSGSSGTQDVTGGWYDAGDHGKYVVNGGISLWTMQNQYEMALKNGNASVYDDGTMSIPENSNGYPDLLDEARYEMEWMFKMLVPEGEYAGMAYHKVHDIKWTALALAPADDPEERIIKPPTTAATLNLSACAAQAYRLWKDIDKAFADQCLENAKLAYESAKKHPDMYAPLDESVGGGPYGDDNAKDEFYWAACELYLATGDQTYLKDAQSSEYYLKMYYNLSGGEDVDTSGSFNWGNVSALGNLSLALYEDTLGSDFSKLTDSICSAADHYTELTQSQGYGQPYEQSTISYENNGTGYSWGSNSFVVNNCIILSYAYELTGDEKYLNGAVSGMDYILGRNPLDYSYVTGYGSHAVRYPHHRWWSFQADDSFPEAPSGVLVGGPNSGMQDPWVKGSGWKPGTIAPAKCYMDNIEAWSVNECTINWNTPLAWMSAYLSDKGGGIIVTHGSSDASAVKNETAENNSAAGSYKENDYSQSENGQKDSSKRNLKGGPGLVPLIAGIALAALILEITIFCISRKSSGKKKNK